MNKHRVFKAQDGKVWRYSESVGWTTLEPGSPAKLLALFQSDAANTPDWFHARAGDLALELERAMREVGLIKELS